MGQVVTTLVIDADTSGAGVYQEAMQGAEEISKSTMQALAGLGSGFSALTSVIAGGGIVAAVIGVSNPSYS